MINTTLCQCIFEDKPLFMNCIPLETPNIHPSQKELLAIIDSFFEQHTKKECSEEIWNLTVAFAGQPDISYPSAVSRSNTTLFCSQVHALLMELHKFWKKHNKTGSDLG